jgi:N-terminal half of MaoC dehydratase
MPIERFPVEEGHILLFARAIGDPNPIYSDREAAAGSELGGIIAPPTFVMAGAQFDPDYPLRPKLGEPWFGSAATPSGTAPSAGGAGSGSSGGGGGGGGGRVGGLHAEQRFEYHRVLRAGDVLHATTRRGRTWEKQGRRGGTLVFAETVTEYRDENDELVVTATSVGVRTEKVPTAEEES